MEEYTGISRSGSLAFAWTLRDVVRLAKWRPLRNRVKLASPLTLSPEAMDPSEDFDSLTSLWLQLIDLNLQQSHTRRHRSPSHRKLQVTGTIRKLHN